MKTKLPFLIVLLFFTSFFATAQQEKGIYGTENWLEIWTDFKPEDSKFNSPTRILSGRITKDTKLSKRETYLLSGNVFVTDSTTLTIEAGTVILGDYKSKGSLVINNGSTIIAEGTQTDPIIFTSNRDLKKPGDWGGIFILGDAPVNKIGDSWILDVGLKPSDPSIMLYGGANNESGSGILKYVRIEYAGKRTKDNGYYSGLTLAGVGDNTFIENVMISYSQGNSLNVIGGELKLDNFISFRSRKNDLIFNYGAQVKIANSLVVKSPFYSASTGDSSIYLANYDDVEETDITKKSTHLNATNLTLMVLTDDLNNAIDIGLVNEALYVKEGATFSIEKSVFSGFNPAVVINSKTFINDDNLKQMKFSNMYFNNCRGNIFLENNTNNDDLEYWYGNAIFQNVYSKSSDKETFIESNDLSNPDFRLRINKIIAINLPDED